MKRPFALLAACLLIVGCEQTPVSVKIEPSATPEAQEVDVGRCTTVVLFDKVKVQKPSKDIPPEYARFLGKWEKGAWNNLWCHDLLVTSIKKDGSAEVFDMHGPYDPWGQPASAFKRKAKIDADGQLRFRIGDDQLSYRIEGNKLLGTRAGKLGTLTVTLRQQGSVPFPVPRPANLAAAAAATPPT